MFSSVCSAIHAGFSLIFLHQQLQCVYHSFLIVYMLLRSIIESQSAFSIFIILTDGKIDDIGASNEQVCDFYYYYNNVDSDVQPLV